MYKPRKIEQQDNWLDESGVKIYTITYQSNTLDQSLYKKALISIKQSIDIPWKNTAAFTIFHEGELYPYLILGYWQNGNELFVRVYVHINKHWLEDPAQFSFCLYDMEVMWNERNICITTIDNDSPSLDAYQNTRLQLESQSAVIE